MSDKIYFQWQNEVLLQTIYPLREMKLRDFLVHFKEIDLWAENKGMPSDELETRIEKYRVKQAQAITDMVETFYDRQDYFLGKEVRLVYSGKFETLDEDVLNRIELLHGAFATYLPTYKSARREKIFVAGRVLAWEKYRKQVMDNIAHQKLRVQRVPEANRPNENEKLKYLENVVLPMVNEEYHLLNSFVSSYNKVAIRKQGLEKSRGKLQTRKDELGTRIKAQRKKIKPVEDQFEEIQDTIARIKTPPDLEAVAQYFSFENISNQIRDMFRVADEKLLGSFNSLHKALNLILNKTKDDAVKLVYIGTETEKMSGVKARIEREIDSLVDRLDALSADSPQRAGLESALEKLRDMKLKAVMSELKKLGDLKAALENSRLTKDELTKTLNEKENEIKDVQGTLAQMKGELKGLEDELEPINRELAIPEKDNLVRFVPEKPITVNDIVMDEVEEYKNSLMSMGHQELLEEVVKRFLAQPERYPLWLQYMVIHFSGMRYASAHGSWADPVELLLNLRTDEIEKDFRNKDDDAIQVLCEKKLEYYDPSGEQPSDPDDQPPAFAKSNKQDDKEKIEGYVKNLKSEFPYQRRRALFDLSLDEDKYEVEAMQPSEVLEALKSYRFREKDPLPDWMWKEIVQLTDLRIDEVTDSSWEKLTPKEREERNSSKWGKYREMMNDWKAEHLTGWRKEHDQTSQLIVTRAVCNEVAEYIQHLRGHEGAAGLTQKPGWYMGEERKFDQNPQERPDGLRPYFVKSKKPEDFSVGASILWLLFVRSMPDEWRVALPLETKDGDGLIAAKYLRKNPGLNEWGYHQSNFVLRRRSFKRNKQDKHVAKETQFLRWIHEATVAEVAETAEGTVVLTFETALPYEDRRLSTIGVFKRYPNDLLSDLGEDAYNPTFVGFVPEAKLTKDAVEDMEHMLDWNAILGRDVMTPEELENYRDLHIRNK